MSGVATFLLTAFSVLVLVEVCVNVVLRPQQGPAALAAVFEPYLLASGAVAGLLEILLSLGAGRAGAPVRLLGLAVVVVAVVRLGGEWWSSPATGEAGADSSAKPGAVILTVLSWNLELGSKAAADSVAGIVEADADLVALQELTPEVMVAIEADPDLRKRYAAELARRPPPADGSGGARRRNAGRALAVTDGH
ncbi:MAG: hypothetical protein ACYC65_05690 [Candidatus Limnocylindrales bacterium]